MSDFSVADALRSPRKLVVIEAPGGCGKTFQGAAYAQELGASIAPGRLLILAHTHAACDVFAERTLTCSARVEVRTIDSLAAEVAAAYPPVAGVEALDFAATACWAAQILRQAPFVAEALARRYPVLICDEHQDASADQHAMVMALHRAGASLRIFGDPMQLIYGASERENLAGDLARWTAIVAAADVVERLDTPHRWRGGNERFGRWLLEARETLQAGKPLDLKNERPPHVRVLEANNVSPVRLGFALDPPSRRLLSNALRSKSLMVLSPHRKTGQAIRAAFGRCLPIWEGHTRSALDGLVKSVAMAEDAVTQGEAMIAFCQIVCTGFSDSAFANRLRAEIAGGCSAQARGKPAQLQGMARHLVKQPDHRGVSLALRELASLVKNEPSFTDIHIDYPQEFWEASRLGDYSDLSTAWEQLGQRRRHFRRGPPARAISTVHKAKGLEFDNVLLMPCDASTFKETDRRLLYVAISRATRSLTIVVSTTRPSPLIRV